MFAFIWEATGFAMIVLSNVSCQYKFAKKVFDNLNIQFNDAEIVSVLGDEESGKSTLFKILIGMEQYSGTVLYDGEVLNKKPNTIIALYSQHALFSGYSVKYNLGYTLKIRKSKKEDIQLKLNEVVKFLQLENIISKKTCRLSEYEKVKVCLGRLLIRDAKYYLVDDVFRKLNSEERGKAFQLFKEIAGELKNKNKVVVYFTRNKKEAIEVADRLCIVANCELKEFEDKKTILENPQNIYSVIMLKNKNNVLACDIVNNKLIDRMGEITAMEKDEILKDKTSVYVYIPEDAFIVGSTNTLQVKETIPVDNRYLYTLSNNMTVLSNKVSDRISFDIDMSKVSYFDISSGRRIK